MSKDRHILSQMEAACCVYCPTDNFHNTMLFLKVGKLYSYIPHF